MTPERYFEITRLCQAAMELNPSQRAVFLTQACAEDQELRAEVEALLAADAEENSFIDAPALEVAARIFAREHPPLAGERLGNYRIIERIGAGGMGEVYLAEDTRLHRRVALKLLPAAFTRDDERVRRFKQEAQTASALNHPNLLTVYDIGESAGLQFIVTEFVDGRTLRQLLHDGPLPPAQVVEIARQLSDALAAAHQAGIIHRDIKPENIMLRPDGYVKLLDFGLAKLTEKRNPRSAATTQQALTEPGKVMGTVRYMSPEQALGHNTDHRTDIFSLGVVLYELLSGEPPFKGGSQAATYDAILNRTPLALTKCAPNTPPELAAIIDRALEKDANLRYQTAADLRAVLQRLQRDSASQSTAAAPSRAFLTRRRLSIVAGWLALAAAGVYFGAYLLRGWRQVRPADNPVPVAATGLNNISFSQQTDQSGVEYFPTLSPDGQTLIYARQEAGNWALWQQSVGRRDRVNLSGGAGVDDLQPAFAPDGRRIAFHSSRDGGGLFVMDLATRAVRKIINEGFNPTWSPDGEEIAYSTASLTAVEGRPNGELWAVRLATGEKRLVTRQDAVQPVWSPHGHRIAFHSDRADLWTIPAGGGAPVRITHEAALDWNPCWSPDGKYLYFISDRSGSMNLWRVAIDEVSGQVLGPLEPATTPATEMLHLTIARTGGQMAYVQRTKQRRLQALPFDPVSGNVRGAPVFVTHGTGFATHPNVSPDGQWLAYSSSGSAQEDIFMIRTDGSGLRQLTNDIAKDRLPRWSPDGKHIAFYSDREGRNEIWTVAPDGQAAIRQLTFAGNGRAVFPVWSPDGIRMAYHLYGQSSFLFDLRKPWEQQTLQPVSVAGVPESSLHVWDWSPDGKKLACLYYRPHSQMPSMAIYTLPAPGAASRLDTFAEKGDYPAWLSDSRRILYSQAGKLYLSDLQTKTTREIFAPGPGELAEYPAIGRDNRTIYYSLLTLEADVWLMKQPR